MNGEIVFGEHNKNQRERTSTMGRLSGDNSARSDASKNFRRLTDVLCDVMYSFPDVQPYIRSLPS